MTCSEGKGSRCPIPGRKLLLPGSPISVNVGVDWLWLSLLPQPILVMPKLPIGRAYGNARDSHNICTDKQLSHRNYQVRSNMLGSLLLISRCIIRTLPIKILNPAEAVRQNPQMKRLLIICRISLPCLSTFFLSLFFFEFISINIIFSNLFLSRFGTDGELVGQ